MARARTPLPVPLSPRIRIGRLAGRRLEGQVERLLLHRLLRLQVRLRHNRADLVFQFVHLRLQAAASRPTRSRTTRKLIGSERLGQIVEGAPAHRFHGRLDGRVGSNDDDVQPGCQAQQLGQQVQPVLAPGAGRGRPGRTAAGPPAPGPARNGRPRLTRWPIDSSVMRNVRRRLGSSSMIMMFMDRFPQSDGETPSCILPRAAGILHDGRARPLRNRAAVNLSVYGTCGSTWLGGTPHAIHTGAHNCREMSHHCRLFPFYLFELSSWI